MIHVNGINYSEKRILAVAKTGIPIPTDLSKMLDMDSAISSSDCTWLSVMTAGDKLKVLVKPSQGVTDKTKTYLLSKVLLKKCQADSVWVNNRPEQFAPPQRGRY